MAAAGDTEIESSPDQQRQLLYLKLAFLAREPPNCILALARGAGGGSITLQVQNFILENCIGTGVEGPQNYAYVTAFLKKIIVAAELSSNVVIDGLYEEFGQCMTSKMDDALLNGNERIYKEISFLSATSHGTTCSKLVGVVARLLCSTNMLEGDTGCSLWPSSLFLSEFILSYPNIFSNKCCFELGSGVGLVGIALNHVDASKVILTDGDTSTLTNMKINLEMNNLCSGSTASQLVEESNNKVEYKYLSWEHASESDLRDYKPDIVLGADIIYDPRCVPHLVRVLSILLRPWRDNKNEYKYSESENNVEIAANKEIGSEISWHNATEGPIAYMATIIRNLDTFNCFAKLAADANLCVANITSIVTPLNLLPHMLSYDRSSVQLLRITLLNKLTLY